MNRLSLDEYFINIVNEVGKRGTCDMGKSGCVIVKDKSILTTGYVGAPTGIAHCDEEGHLIKKVTHEDGRETLHCLRTVHAELNAIIQAAKFGTSIDGATLYCSMEPCFTCAKAIINAGIKRVVAEKRYHDSNDTYELFNKAGIEFIVLKDELINYENM